MIIVVVVVISLSLGSVTVSCRAHSAERNIVFDNDTLAFLNVLDQR